MRLPLLLVFLSILMLPACDLVEVVPPDEPPPVEPPPAQPVHPYGAGRGKVVFLSDLAVAQRIDVTLGGEPIGAITRFVGCPSRVTTDDSLATAIRPAGNYQYSARSTTGLSWPTTTVQIAEDGLKRITFIGRPRQYAVHLPDQLEGRAVTVWSSGTGAVLDQFHLDLQGNPTLRIRVGPPDIVQGDRYDLVFNGSVLARGASLGTTAQLYDPVLQPGPNWFAVRLTQDADGDGTSAELYLDFDDGGSRRYLSIGSGEWRGQNIRYAC